MVAERHKSGLPHYHALVHEVHQLYPVTYRILTDAWDYGHIHAKLVQGPAAARYCAKYLSKSAEARVRASGAYGRWDYPPSVLGLTDRPDFFDSLAAKAKRDNTPPVMTRGESAAQSEGLTYV